MLNKEIELTGTILYHSNFVLRAISKHFKYN